jgi:hypothetical protein
MEISDVQDEIEAAANALGVVAPNLGTSKGKAYEVWVLFEIAVRLLRRGYWAMPSSPADRSVMVFRVRGSPSGMPDGASTATDEPSHFILAGSQRALEMHIGLQARGVSLASHEIDVSVLPHELGSTCRTQGGGIYAGPLTHGLELKAYDKKHKFDQAIPRAVLGVAVDLNPSWVFATIVLRTSGGAETVSTPVNRTRFALMTSTGIYDNSRRLLDQFGVMGAEELLPKSAGAIDALVDEIAHLLDTPSPYISPPPRPRAAKARAMPGRVRLAKRRKILVP